MLAVIAGSGLLPGEIVSQNHSALFVRMEGVDADNPGATEISASFERLGQLFDGLRAHGVTEVCLAGAMARPALNPVAFDSKMQALAPRLLAAMQGGDDALLRLVISVFEEEGFHVRGAHSLVPHLTAQTGHLAGPEPSQAALADARRATAILTALGPLDVGQGAVVAAGLCLGIETIQGTDFLLRTVRETPERLRRGKGVLVKRPKAGQDLRVDMPAIGPGTVEAAAAAGLEGIVIAHGAVVLLDRDELIRKAEEAGLFLRAE